MYGLASQYHVTLKVDMAVEVGRSSKERVNSGIRRICLHNVFNIKLKHSKQCTVHANMRLGDVTFEIKVYFINVNLIHEKGYELKKLNFILKAIKPSHT